MLLQLQDFGTSLWQLRDHAISLPRCLKGRERSATYDLFLRRGRRVVAPDRCCGDGQLGSDRGNTGHVSDVVKSVLVTQLRH